jgi:hypothetical protein
LVDLDGNPFDSAARFEFTTAGKFHDVDIQDRAFFKVLADGVQQIGPMQREGGDASTISEKHAEEKRNREFYFIVKTALISPVEVQAKLTANWSAREERWTYILRINQQDLKPVWTKFEEAKRDTANCPDAQYEPVDLNKFHNDIFNEFNSSVDRTPGVVKLDGRTVVLNLGTLSHAHAVSPDQERSEPHELERKDRYQVESAHGFTEHAVRELHDGIASRSVEWDIKTQHFTEKFGHDLHLHEFHMVRQQSLGMPESEADNGAFLPQVFYMPSPSKPQAQNWQSPKCSGSGSEAEPAGRSTEELAVDIGVVQTVLSRESNAEGATSMLAKENDRSSAVPIAQLQQTEPAPQTSKQFGARQHNAGAVPEPDPLRAMLTKFSKRMLGGATVEHAWHKPIPPPIPRVEVLGTEMELPDDRPHARIPTKSHPLALQAYHEVFSEAQPDEVERRFVLRDVASPDRLQRLRQNYPQAQTAMPRQMEVSAPKLQAGEAYAETYDPEFSEAERKYLEALAEAPSQPEEATDNARYRHLIMQPEEATEIRQNPDPDARNRWSMSHWMPSWKQDL